MIDPTTTFAAWSAQWLTGLAAPDDVLDALARWAPVHHVHAADPVAAGRLGVPAPQAPASGGAALLGVVGAAVDRTAPALRLVLPTPGDVRGLPPGTELAREAVERGSALLLGAPGGQGLGVVSRFDQPDVLHWQVHHVDVVPESPEVESLAALEYALRQGVRSAAAVIAELALVRDGAARELAARILEESDEHPWPALADRQYAVLATAAQVDATLAAAGFDAHSPAVARGVDARADAVLLDQLRSLAALSARARAAAINTIIPAY